MAVAAQRLEQVQRQEQQENGVIIKRGREETHGSVRLALLVHDAGVLAEEKRKLESDIAELNADILEDIQDLLEDVGTVTLITPDGVHSTKIVVRDAVELEGVEELELFLGDNRFDELVDTKTTHRPTKELRDLALDADNPESETLRKHLVVARCKPTITHNRPAQPKKED